jgi:hypothetical protein
VHKPAHILTPHERDVLTKFLLIDLDERAAVTNLLLAHFLEYLCCTREVLPQAFTVVGINALIFFLQRNG